VLVEIRLHHSALFERDLLAHQLAQTVNDRTLHHALGCAGIDDVVSISAATQVLFTFTLLLGLTLTFATSAK
jgi:hypothetical protein